MSLDNKLEESSGSESEDDDPALYEAETLELMKEEKWLIERIKSMRKRRNELKMDRLNHRNMILPMFAEHENKFGVVLPKPKWLLEPEEPEDEPIPEPVYPELSNLIIVDLSKEWVIRDPGPSHVNMDVDMDKVVGDNGDKGDI